LKDNGEVVENVDVVEWFNGFIVDIVELLGLRFSKP
jgi:hypothetical protein